MVAENAPGGSKKRPRQKEHSSCQGRIAIVYQHIRGATLIHGQSRALGGIPAYPRQLTYAFTSQDTPESCPVPRTMLRFAVPSAAHLTICFSPGSHHPGVSVEA